MRTGGKHEGVIERAQWQESQSRIGDENPTGLILLAEQFPDMGVVRSVHSWPRWNRTCRVEHRTLEPRTSDERITRCRFARERQVDERPGPGGADMDEGLGSQPDEKALDHCSILCPNI